MNNEFLFEDFEEMDLLKLSEMATDFINEATLDSLGFSIGLGFFDKSRLYDEEYVNELIERIDAINVVKKDVVEIIKWIDYITLIIASIPIITIPITLLLFAIYRLYYKALDKLTDYSSDVAVRSLIKATNKAINSLENSKDEVSASERKSIENKIKRLKENRERLKKIKYYKKK